VVKYLFSVYTITEAKESNRQGGAMAEPGRWILTWHALV